VAVAAVLVVMMEDKFEHAVRLSFVNFPHADKIQLQERGRL
jgi:hypothetical protein